MQVSKAPNFAPRRFGKYVLLERIGRGGMAEVYRSKTFGAAGFVKECAIKKILSSLMDDDQFVRMFVDEAKLTARLTHANIVQVLDLGEIEGHLFIAMEYVSGKDLLDVLARSARRGLRIPVELALYIVTEVLKGIDFAHNATDVRGREMNIVHRDVSPSNILISYDGQVKVGDFGIAKSQMQSSKTEVGTQKGKTGYMSPEQVTGGVIDRRSDLFAVSVILFELITMTRLFKAKNDLDVMLKIRDSDVEADLERAARISEDLAKIIRKGLARRPEDRYQTAAEFLEELRDFGQERRMKLGARALAAYVGELFADKIADELERRELDPEADPGATGPIDMGDTSYRYRGREGVIHGPMTQQMLADLLGRRSPNTKEAVSFDGGPWRPPHVFNEFADAARGRSDALDDSDEMEGLGLRAVRGITDWESLAAVRRGRHGSSSTTGSPEAVRGEISDSDGPRRPVESVTAERDILGVTPHSSIAVPESAREQANAQARATVSGAAYAVDDMGEPSERATPSPRDVTPAETVAAPEPDTAPTDAEGDEVPGAAVFTSRRARTRTDVAERGRAHSVSETVHVLTSSDVSEADFSGALGETSLFKVVHRIGAGRLSGRLAVRSGDVSKSFYFADGALVGAESDAATDGLVEVLRAADKITRQQAEDAEARARGGMTLENALLTTGSIAPHELFHFIQEQLSAKLAGCLFWESGQWAWWQDAEFQTDPFGASVQTDELLSRAVSEQSESRYFRRFYKTRRRRKLTQLIPTEELAELKLSARAMRVVANLDDTPNVSEVVRLFCDRYNWPEADVYRTLYVLTEYEVFGFEGVAPADLPSA